MGQGVPDQLHLDGLMAVSTGNVAPRIDCILIMTARCRRLSWNCYNGCVLLQRDAWPTVYVIDADGVIRYKGHGDEMEAAIEKAVADAEKKPAT